MDEESTVINGEVSLWTMNPRWWMVKWSYGRRIHGARMNSKMEIRPSKFLSVDLKTDLAPSSASEAAVNSMREINPSFGLTSNWENLVGILIGRKIPTSCTSGIFPTNIFSLEGPKSAVKISRSRGDKGLAKTNVEKVSEKRKMRKLLENSENFVSIFILFLLLLLPLLRWNNLLEVNYFRQCLFPLDFRFFTQFVCVFLCFVPIHPWCPDPPLLAVRLTSQSPFISPHNFLYWG